MLIIEPRLALINGVLLANRVLIFCFQLLTVYVLLVHNCGECRIDLISDHLKNDLSNIWNIVKTMNILLSTKFKHCKLHWHGGGHTTSPVVEKNCPKKNKNSSVFRTKSLPVFGQKSLPIWSQITGYNQPKSQTQSNLVMSYLGPK
jgi:hypothetical protein